MGQAALEVPTRETRQEMAGFAGSYLRFCAGHLTQLAESIERQDLGSVSEIAHALTGNARRLGLNELSSLGHQLEDYCLGRDWSAIDSAYRAIADTVAKLCEGQTVSIPVVAEPDPTAERFVKITRAE